MKNIIIDTDIGDDIDDALAIAFALRFPEINLLGITTVYKNTKERAQIAKTLLKVAERQSIPVFCGEGMPLVEVVEEVDSVCQYQAYMGQETTEDGAIEFIISESRHYKNDIEIVCIGALTNLAKAIKKAPDIVNCINRIILMGGLYSFHGCEYNILCDPEAAKIVFNSSIEIVAIGVDITRKCKLTDYQTSKFDASKNPTTLFIAKLVELYKVKHGSWPVYLHDPLTIAYLIDPTLLKLERCKIDIELEGKYTRGMTYNLSASEWWNEKPSASKIQIARDVDVKRFVQLFMDKILEV